MSEETHRARNRLTGIVVLVAIAVVLIPVLFDGAGLPPLPEPEVPAAAVAAARELPVAPSFSEQVPASDFVERIQELRESVDEEGFDVRTDTRFGEPVLSTPTPDSHAWAVQVGSFTNEDNATRFRDQLKSDGFEAFISTTVVRDDRQIHHRVAVGPLLDEQGADALKNTLAKRYDRDARVMAFAN